MEKRDDLFACPDELEGISVSVVDTTRISFAFQPHVAMLEDLPATELGDVLYSGRMRRSRSPGYGLDVEKLVN